MDNIQSIQAEKAKEISRNGIPNMDVEHKKIAEHKRMTLDEPPYYKKGDPLR